MIDLPEIRDRIDLRNQYVDGTPDGTYALRILQFFRKRCDEKWIVEGFDDNKKRIYDMMNDHQDLRSKELDKAIRILGKYKE